MVLLILKKAKVSGSGDELVRKIYKENLHGLFCEQF